MNKNYLLSKKLWNFDKADLIKRSGDYFNHLKESAVDNRSIIIECVPVKRRAFASQDSILPFNLNAAGWPMNDISALLHAQTDDEVAKIMSRLVDLRSNGSIPENVSDKDAIRDYIVPRYVGTSSELLTYMEGKFTTTISSDDIQVLDNVEKPASETDVSQGNE